MTAAATHETTGIPRRVWSSAGWLIAGRLFGSACTVVTLLVLSAHLDGGDFGVLTFWLAAFLVLDGIVDFGAGQVAVQRSSRRPETLASVLVTARRARLAVASAVVAVVAVGGIALEGSGGWFLAAAALYQLSHVLELSTIGWRNAIAWRSPVLVRAGASAASLVFVLLLLWTGDTRPLAYLLAIACGSTLGNVTLHAVGRRELPPTAGVRPSPMGPFLAASIPIGAAAVCQQLYFHVDHVFVRFLQGDEAVGHYGVAVRVMSLSIMAGVFAAGAALPWLSRCHGRGELLPAALRLTLTTGSLGALVVAVITPLRSQVLGAFGAGFLDAGSALGWLMAAAFLVHVGAPLLTAVVARGDGPKVLGIAGAGLAINLVGNALLAPTWGMDGAAAATVATEGWVVIASLLVLLEARGAAVSAPPAPGPEPRHAADG